MQTFLRHSKIICYLLAALTILDCVAARAGTEGDEPKLEIDRIDFSGDLVYIYYSLSGMADRTYTVSVSLRKRSDSSYRLTPGDAIGDVGASVAPGTDKRIILRMSGEFPKGLRKEDYFFLVSVDPEASPKGGVSTTVMIVGGAAIVGGVVTWLLLSQKTEEPANDKGFPPPPGRP
jgi:hypothetical protein